MRTQQMLDELQALVERSGRMPGMGKKAVDERRFYSLLGQLRESLPADLREASRTIQEKDKMIAEASAKAEEIKAKAQEQSARLVEESEITHRAHADAEEIVRQADLRAEAIRQDAHTYASQVLEKIETMINRLAAGVQEGRAALTIPQPKEQQP